MLGAKELRFGVSKLPTWAGSRVAGPNLVTMVPMERFLDFLAVRVKRPKAEAKFAAAIDAGDETFE